MISIQMLPIIAILKGLFLISIEITVLISWHHPYYLGDIRINILSDCLRCRYNFFEFPLFKIVEHISQQF